MGCVVHFSVMKSSNSPPCFFFFTKLRKVSRFQTAGDLAVVQWDVQFIDKLIIGIKTIVIQNKSYLI